MLFADSAMVLREPQRARPSLPFLAGMVTSTILIGVILLVLNVIDARTISKSQDLYQPTKNATTENSTESTVTSTLQSLEGLEKIASGFGRMAGLRRLLASSDETQTLELLDQSDAIESDYLQLKVRIEVLRRLAAFNPELAASRVMEYPRRIQEHLLPAVIGEWASFDLEAAAVQISRLDKSLGREAIKSLLLATENLQQVDLGDLANAAEFEGALSGLIEEIAVETAIHDPEKSWNAVINDSWRNGSQLDSLAAIAEAWIDRDGWDVLDGIVESLPNPLFRTQLLERLLHSVARHSPERAFEQSKRLVGSSNSIAFHFIVGEWVRQSPVAALNAISMLDDETSRADLQQSAIQTWARSDPRALLEHLPNLSEDIRSMARQEAIQGIALISPHEAIELISTVQGEVGAEIAITVGYRMSQEDAREALNWALTDSRVDEHRFSVLQRMMAALVAENLDLAMRTALDQPVSQWGRALESSVVRSLISSERFDEAISILPRVREGSVRLQAYAEVGTDLALNGEIQKSFDLAEGLADTQREAYYERLLSRWAGTNPQGLANSLDELPNQKRKLQAARLLRNYRNNLLESQWQRVDSLAQN